MAGVIDADTHVVESEAVWDLFDPDVFHRRPVAIVCEDLSPTTLDKILRTNPAHFYGL